MFLLAILGMTQAVEQVARRDMAITFPGPLNRALSPYLFCTVEALNAGTSKFGGAPENHRAVRNYVVEACRETRKKATREAKIGIERHAHHLSPKDQAAMLEATLKNVDRLHESATPFADDPTASETYAPNR